mgnify:CR=1 FL=1|jgi:hypothetical protein|tara:strand:+ start:114 stop:287 length:174 start_codon:yes stop_codon:yes gene_type:complete
MDKELAQTAIQFLRRDCKMSVDEIQTMQSVLNALAIDAGLAQAPAEVVDVEPKKETK